MTKNQNLWQGFKKKFDNQSDQEPQILTDDELKALNQPIKQKLAFRWVVLALGCGLILTAIVAYFQEWSISWFILGGINFSLAFPILVSMLGFWVISRVAMNINGFRENSIFLPHLSSRKEALLHQVEQTQEIDFVKTRCIASSRLIAALLPIIIGIINAYLFGIVFVGQLAVGNWFTLGGSSLFYPLSLFPLCVAIGLLIYFIFSSAILTFTKTPHLYQVEEYRLMAPWMTEIPRAEIQAVQLTNAHTGPKYVWVFLLGPQIVWLLTDGFHYLTNPFTFGYGFQTGWAYVITAFVQIAILIILLLKTQTFLELVSDTKRYELQMALPFRKPKIRGAIEEVFDLPAVTEEQKKFNQFNLENIASIPPEKLTTTVCKDWTNIFTGIIFIVISILSESLQFFVGIAAQMVLVFFGIMLIVKGLKSDFSSPRKQLTIKYDPQNRTLNYRKEWLWYNSIMKFNNIDSENFRYSIQVPKLNFFDGACAIVVPIFLGVTLGGFLWFVPASAGLWWVGLSYLLITAFLLIILVKAILNAQNTVVIQTASIHYEIALPGIATEEQRQIKETKGWWGEFKYKWQTIIKEQRQAVLLRVLVIGICFVCGILFAILF